MTDETALGLIETRGLVAAVVAADAMAKAASVRIVRMEVTEAALVTVQVVGEVAAVQAAVEAGRRAAEPLGEVLSAHVIPRADDAVRDLLGLAPPAAAASGPAKNDLRALTVQELRSMARGVDGFPLQGRAIARATKKQLVELLSGSG